MKKKSKSELRVEILDNWSPQIGDIVNIDKKPDGTWLPDKNKIHGTISGKVSSSRREQYRVEYVAPWGVTSGYFYKEQMLPAEAIQ